MIDDTEMYELAIGRKQKKLLLSAVVVLLAMGMAVSGWLIVSALQNMQDEDAFSMERIYDAFGTITEDGVSVPCSGKILSKFSSEKVVASVMTYKANNSTSVHPIDQFSYSIMFDSERIPTDRFSYFGKEGDYDKWKGTDKGVDVIYYLDSESVVHQMDIEYENMRLYAVMNQEL